MKTWNLTDFSQLESPVWGAYENPPRKRPEITRRVRASFTIAVGVAVVSTAVSVYFPRVTSATMVVPVTSMAVAQSIPPEAPPLERLFKDRFDSGWTPEVEQTALQRLAAHHREGSAAYNEEEAVDVVLANQDEQFAADSPKLSRDEVVKVVRKRRSA